MLSLADAGITNRDRALPGLAMLLDDERLLAALRMACPCCAIEAIEVSYTRYKPGTSCVVGFTLTVGGTRIPGYVRTDGGGRSGAAALDGGASGVAALVRGGRFALSDGATVVSVFPNDRRMAGLLEISAPERLDSLLKDLGPAAEHLRADACVELLAYRPEHSFVGKLVSRNGQAVLKFPGDRNYRPMALRAERFGGGSVRVAALVAHSDRHRAEIFEWLDGRLLSEALHDSAFDIHTMSLVGAALAEFHAHVRAGLVELPPTTREALQVHADGISALCPQLAELARRVADLLGASLDDEPRCHRRLHGDFHPRQILIDGQSVAFLDLGEGLMGHPTVDVGLFLAHLEREAVRRSRRASWVEPIAAAFLDGYEAASAVPIRQFVPRALARGLFRLAPRSFRRREADWAAQMAALLERAQEVANENQVECWQ
jgi:streptomycin 6-kinase